MMGANGATPKDQKEVFENQSALGGWVGGGVWVRQQIHTSVLKST